MSTQIFRPRHVLNARIMLGLSAGLCLLFVLLAVAERRQGALMATALAAAGFAAILAVVGGIWARAKVVLTRETYTEIDDKGTRSLRFADLAEDYVDVDGTRLLVYGEAGWERPLAVDWDAPWFLDFYKTLAAAMRAKGRPLPPYVLRTLFANVKASIDEMDAAARQLFVPTMRGALRQGVLSSKAESTDLYYRKLKNALLSELKTPASAISRRAASKE